MIFYPFAILFLAVFIKNIRTNFTTKQVIKHGNHFIGEVVLTSSYVFGYRSRTRTYIFKIKFIGPDGKLKLTQVDSSDPSLLQMNESVSVFIGAERPHFAAVKTSSFAHLTLGKLLTWILGFGFLSSLAFQFFVAKGLFFTMFSTMSWTEKAQLISVIPVSYIVSYFAKGPEDKGNIESIDQAQLDKLIQNELGGLNWKN